MSQNRSSAVMQQRSEPLVGWAWLTPRGNLIPFPTEREARSLLGRGPVALVKVTFKSQKALDLVNRQRREASR